MPLPRQLCQIMNQADKPQSCCEHKKIVGFSPHGMKKYASIVKQKTNTPVVMTTDENVCMLPANSIIDMVEFFGLENFQTSGTFNIGLGQLNDVIILPLVEKAKATTANERNGGSRQFISTSADGSNEKHVTLYDSPININIEKPITSGHLLIHIFYHTKC